MGVCHGGPQGGTAVHCIGSCCRAAHEGFQFAEPGEHIMGVCHGGPQEGTCVHCIPESALASLEVVGQKSSKGQGGSGACHISLLLLGGSWTLLGLILPRFFAFVFNFDFLSIFFRFHVLRTYRRAARDVDECEFDIASFAQQFKRKAEANHSELDVARTIASILC